MVSELAVWLSGRHIGALTQAAGRLSFVYAPEWLARHAQVENASTTPLSQSLPLRAEPFDDQQSRPYFAGLLPEGEKRALIATALQVSEKNDFGLLHGIGGECAGAVTLLERGRELPSANSPSLVRWLDERQLLQLIDEMPKRPMLAGEDGLRLSLAGVQDKLPVVFDGERIGLPMLGAPSSHIIKPAIAGVEGSVFNEGFCMRLAHSLKLDVAKASIRRVNDQHYLLVKRYDRLFATDGNQSHQQRLHQEDFCQALGIAPELKYQNEGGPDLAQCFDLIRRATRPSAPSTLKLLDYVVFNALIGNHDAHAKNFSLLYTPNGAALAPLYDALSTAVYPNLAEKMAMKIASKYKFVDLQARHWEQFAVSAGLSPALAKKRIFAVAKRLPDLARKTQSELESEGHDHPVIEQIVALVEQRCEMTMRRLGAAGNNDLAQWEG